MRRIFLVPLLTFVLLSLTACSAQSACPPRADMDRNLSLSDLEALSSQASENSSSPTEAEINGKLTAVDKIITGPLCNDTWKGTVYVACHVQVLEWKEEPLFLKDCNLSIEPGTVVYVAYHNDAAYYNGCSCHTGEQPLSHIQ